MTAKKRAAAMPCVGWREWVGLPDLDVSRIKAKVDTGARTSALHAFHIRTESLDDGRQVVRFQVHPLQRSAADVVDVEAELLGRRMVRNSGGARTLRPVIRTTLRLGEAEWPIELTLVGRDAMGFRMLLGREALRRRVLVHPGRSFLASRAEASLVVRRKGANR